jgi:hypothetical protein
VRSRVIGSGRSMEQAPPGAGKEMGFRRPWDSAPFVAVTETVTHAARHRATGRYLPPRLPGAMRPQSVEKAGDSGDRRRELSIQRSRVQVPSSPPFQSLTRHRAPG